LPPDALAQARGTLWTAL